jgi:hypothetical protein
MFDRFKSVQIDFNAILKRVLQAHEKDIEELNREQLMKGERSDGTKLPPYTPSYAKRKNKPLTPKTLKDKGDFQEEIFTTFFEKSFNVESNDWKSEFLESNWGKKIFGLSDKNKERLLHEKGVATEVINEVKKYYVQKPGYAGKMVS